MPYMICLGGVGLSLSGGHSFCVLMLYIRTGLVLLLRYVARFRLLSQLVVVSLMGHLLQAHLVFQHPFFLPPSAVPAPPPPWLHPSQFRVLWWVCLRPDDRW